MSPLDDLDPVAELLASASTEDDSFTFAGMKIGELIDSCPELRPAVIDGLLRQGETMNVIAPPKLGKSWLVLGLALSVATGRTWFNTFPVRRGKVLLIDNELHPETLARRVHTVAQAMNPPPRRTTPARSRQWVIATSSRLTWTAANESRPRKPRPRRSNTKPGPNGGRKPAAR